MMPVDLFLGPGHWKVPGARRRYLTSNIMHLIRSKRLRAHATKHERVGSCRWADVSVERGGLYTDLHRYVVAKDWLVATG